MDVLDAEQELEVAAAVREKAEARRTTLAPIDISFGSQTRVIFSALLFNPVGTVSISSSADIFVASALMAAISTVSPGRSS